MGRLQKAVTTVRTELAVRNVNGDGKPDLFVANACGNNGDEGCIGSLGVHQWEWDVRAAVNYTSGGYEPDSVAVKDVDGTASRTW
jgi:hypothetical protein